MEDIFDKLQAVTGITKYSNSEVITPKEIVTDMADLLPAEVFNKDSRFLDPAVKSGRFLVELYRRLMDSPLMVSAFPNEQGRHEHILCNQLFGLATSGTAATIVRKQLYDDPTIAGNIVYTADKVTKEVIQGAFGDMKFDVVIGNPPYNNDIYLDFVQLCFDREISGEGYKPGILHDKGYACFITPAKWQAKGGDKNEQFRKDIVPHISKIVFYPDTREVFDIDSQGGISYYLMSKDTHSKKHLKTICKIQKMFETTGEWELCDISKVMYNTKIQGIIAKLGDYTQLSCQNNAASGRFNVAITNVYSEKNCTNKKGSALVTISPYVVQNTIKRNADTSFLESFENQNEAESYISYLETKFIRFMFLMAKCSLHMQSDFSWRFIPDPGAFDHIFTDQELYQKYGLTPDEIAIIESVIKERK